MGELILPETPTDGELSKTFTSRPDWTAMSQMVEGVNGKDLFDDRDFGPGTLEQIQQSHIEIRNYLKRYDRKGGDYWQDRRGRQELIGESYAKERTAEINLWTDLMNRMVVVMADYTAARTDAENEAKRKLEQQQREEADRIRKAELAEAEAAMAEANAEEKLEIGQRIDFIKSVPIIPPVVTPAQAAAAVGLPAMPKGLVSNKKPIYERVITDKKKFIAWLAAHPAYIDTIAMSFSFTNLKHSDVQIDGVSMGQKSSIVNRGK